MVIQRWQSVLLLICVVLMGCFSFMSLGQINVDSVYYDFMPWGIIPMGDNAAESVSVSTWYIFAISLLSALLPLIAIFTFKNLKLQKRLCMLTVVALICVILACAIIAYQAFSDADVDWSSMICAPFISLISVAMAYQRISADQRTIRESERLR
ncbi:MAG: DUF4293 domain-containing protein [Muribaculaceae bacterium]|nr:DUF4293 domain-containing protein [Muribaculaceae bacterium]MDE6559486.1 DUF4293 domain-containing protein [Muribaculaceae bacterium]